MSTVYTAILHRHVPRDKVSFRVHRGEPQQPYSATEPKGKMLENNVKQQSHWETFWAEHCNGALRRISRLSMVSRDYSTEENILPSVLPYNV